jgi:flagellar protein FlgJ
MAVSARDSSLVADPTQLAALRRDAKAQTPEALRETARQFEGLFTNMLLKSMRDATPEDSLFGSEQQDFYTDLFDQQLAASLSKGKGLGLADLLVRQLMQTGQARDAQDMAPAAPAFPENATAARFRPGDRQSFIDALKPVAEEAGRKLGVAPEALIAHAALETGWGRSMPVSADGRCSNNLFGIKAGGRWTGAAAEAMTTEYEGQTPRRELASFRAYDSPADSVRDYADLLARTPRYAAVLGTGDDVGAFGRALQSGGYATDPDYAKKLERVAQELKLAPERPLTVNDVTRAAAGVP